MEFTTFGCTFEIVFFGVLLVDIVVVVVGMYTRQCLDRIRPVFVG